MVDSFKILTSVLSRTAGWTIQAYLDEHSLVFFRFSEGSARERERRAKREKRRETMAAAREEKRRDFLFSCLSRLAPSVTHVLICISYAFCWTDQEKRETARSVRVLG